MQITPAPSTLTVPNGSANVTTMTSRVDPEGARRMMEMLVNLYADQRLAVVREYTANGVDAARVSGSNKPVNIITPTPMEPSLVITDHGTGMSLDEVERTYLAFAASSKRDSNDQVGGLGVGAKSAWALAESFLVDTVKDGKRTIVRAARDLSHQVMLAGEPTELPAGTTVSIPIKLDGEAAKWQKVIASVATAHDPGTVTVDGKPVKSIAGGLNKIGPIICVDLAEHGWDFKIRSGGTLFDSPYEVEQRVRRKGVKLRGGVIELPIGSFDHTPSRESVVSSDRTLAAVDAAVNAHLVAYKELELRIAELAKVDVTAAVKLRTQSVGDVGDYTVLPVDFSFKIPGDAGGWAPRGRGWKKIADKKDDTCVTDSITATALDNELSRTVIITDVPAGRKLRTFARFMKDDHSNASRIIPIPAGSKGIELPVIDGKGIVVEGQVMTLDATLVPERNVHTFDEFKELTAPQRGDSRGPQTGYTCKVTAVDGANWSQRELTGPEIAALGLPVWYVDELAHNVDVAQKASVGVILGRRKAERLLKSIPGAMTLHQFQSKVFTEASATWSEDVKLALASSSRDYVKVFALAKKAQRNRMESGRCHPALDRATVIAGAFEVLTADQKKVFEAMRSFHHSGAFSKVFEEAEKVARALKSAWPLLKGASGYGQVNDAAAYVDYLTAVEPR